MGYLSDDSYVTLLLCSDLVIDRNMIDSPKPYTTDQWQKLSKKIMQSSIKRPANLIQLDTSALEKLLDISHLEAKRIEVLLERKMILAVEIDRLKSKGIYITTRAEKNYPVRLKRILKEKCPPVIYYAGDINLSSFNSMAIVGSRNADHNSADFTGRLARRCVESGIVVVSGGAKGVDNIAESSALASGGKVISIVADSLSKKIAVNINREAIINGNLLMMSMVNPDVSFKAFNAMNRNKYVYSMSNAATVIASDFGKGGTWTGAIENLKNSWVKLFVRDEDEIPLGNKELIKKGGIPLSKDKLFNQFDFKKWLFANKESSISLKVDQLSLDEYVNDLTMKKSHDIYDIVIEKILDNLTKPLSSLELASMFNVLVDQMNVWLDRAVQSGTLQKLQDENLYIDSLKSTQFNK